MWGASKKNAEAIEQLKSKIEQLEDHNRSLMMTLQNLQSAILSLSRSHDHVSHDVSAIQEMVAAFLSEIDPGAILYGYGKRNPEA